MKKGQMSFLTALMITISIIVILGFFILNISDFSKKAVGDENSGMELPALGKECVVETDKTVSKHKYLEYIKDASAMAWHNGQVCYVKVGGIDEVPTNTEVVEAMRLGQAGLIDFLDDFCTDAGNGYDVPDEGVFIWRGDKGYCNNGVLSTLLGTMRLDFVGAFKASFSADQSAGDLKDTLYLYSTKDYCQNDELESNNYDRYSQTRGTYNNYLCFKNGLGLPKDSGIFLTTNNLVNVFAKGCIKELSVSEELKVVLENVYSYLDIKKDEGFFDFNIFATSKYESIMGNIYIDNYNKDKIKTCEKLSHSYNGFSVKDVADELEAQIDLDAFKIDHNKPIVSTYSDGLCKFDVGDWAYSMSPEESCVYIIVDGVWVKPSEIYKHTGVCDLEVRMFYKYEKDNSVPEFIHEVNTKGSELGECVEVLPASDNDCIYKSYQLALDTIVPDSGLDDLIIEFITKSGNPKPYIVGPEVPEGELEPDDCVPICIYDTQFCCDKGANVYACQSGGCSGVTYPWTDDIYNTAGCNDLSKTYLYCYVGYAWDDSDTKYDIPASVSFSLVTPDGEKSGDLYGDILENGGYTMNANYMYYCPDSGLTYTTGGDTIAQGLTKIFATFDDITETFGPDTCDLVLNQNSINDIVDDNLPKDTDDNIVEGGTINIQIG